MKCSTSQAKHKLFIGNIPKNWGEEDIKKIVNKVGPGVISVELLKVRLPLDLSVVMHLAVASSNTKNLVPLFSLFAK